MARICASVHADLTRDPWALCWNAACAVLMPRIASVISLKLHSKNSWQVETLPIGSALKAAEGRDHLQPTFVGHRFQGDVACHALVTSEAR